MPNIQTILLFVFTSSQICGSQIFGGAGPQGHGHGVPPPRGGILGHGPHNGARGGILGGQGIGPGGREGILNAMNGLPGGHQQRGDLRGHPHAASRSNKKNDRIRMGPIVFDSEHLEHDDNDDYSDHDDDDDSYQSRPKLGLDLSNLFLPIGNFLKLTAKSLETMFTLLEKQANLLLGRKIGREGSISVTIVIIISWLVMGLVVYAFAQFAILRRIRDEELEAEQEEQEIANLHQQFLAGTPGTAVTAAPSLKTTPPTPSPKAEAAQAAVKSIWLPSVGTLQLSESSILKRRESRKRRKRMAASKGAPTSMGATAATASTTSSTSDAAKDARIRHRGCNVDVETIAWIESGLDRLSNDSELMTNVLLKWNTFLTQHVMQNFSQDDFHIKFIELARSDLPNLAKIDVEMSDEENLIITMDIEVSFDADFIVSSSKSSDDSGEDWSEMRLTVSKLGTRLECKLARNDVEESTVHIRQTGHVVLESHLVGSCENPNQKSLERAQNIKNIMQKSIVNALKNVDCDLPPLSDICKNARDSNGGIFVESPYSFSSLAAPTAGTTTGTTIVSNGGSGNDNVDWDYLHVSVLRASLEESKTGSCCYFHPYVILEMDHPAQRHRTSRAHSHKSQRSKQLLGGTGALLPQRPSIDFTWPESNFKFHISREKTLELLVELWESEDPHDHGGQEAASKGLADGDDECCQSDPSCCCSSEAEGNLSPGAVGHRFLGLCLVSVQDLMATLSQNHIVSLQGRPFLDDSVLNWTITLKFDYVPDASMIQRRGTSAKPLVSFNTATFHGVHKTLEMIQGLDHNGQPTFITNSAYCIKGGGSNETLKTSYASNGHQNSVALAAVRDLQTQQSLRMGAPLPTKSVLLIRAVQAIDSSKLNKTPELVTPTYCDDEKTPEVEERFLATSVNEDKFSTSSRPPVTASETASAVTAAEIDPSQFSPGSEKKAKSNQRKGFLATLRERLYFRKSKAATTAASEDKDTSSVPSQDLSSSVNDMSDSASSCSGRSSCCTEASYHCTSWKGGLSTSWQSLASTNSTLMLPSVSGGVGAGSGANFGSEDASSLSDASGISLNSSSVNITGTPPPTGKRNLTALILETVEEHGFRVHYLIPNQLSKKLARLRRKGVKLHVSNEHLFVAKHIKSGTICSVCQKKIITRLGKKCYVCRDCGLTCHKRCYDRTTVSCSLSSLDSMELLRGSTLLKKKGP